MFSVIFQFSICFVFSILSIFDIFVFPPSVSFFIFLNFRVFHFSFVLHFSHFSIFSFWREQTQPKEVPAGKEVAILQISFYFGKGLLPRPLPPNPNPHHKLVSAAACKHLPHHPLSSKLTSSSKCGATPDLDGASGLPYMVLQPSSRVPFRG